LTKLAIEELLQIPGVRIIGPTDPANRGSAVSFVIDGIHPHDVGQVLDNNGIAVRVGHHCAWPVCRRYEVPATTRATFYIYNDESDVYALRDGIIAAQKLLSVVLNIHHTLYGAWILLYVLHKDIHCTAISLGKGIIRYKNQQQST
jgi:cysteine desulfurase/selenocysteine lyase